MTSHPYGYCRTIYSQWQEEKEEKKMRRSKRTRKRRIKFQKGLSLGLWVWMEGGSRGWIQAVHISAIFKE